MVTGEMLEEGGQQPNRPKTDPDRRSTGLPSRSKHLGVGEIGPIGGGRGLAGIGVQRPGGISGEGELAEGLSAGRGSTKEVKRRVR